MSPGRGSGKHSDVHYCGQQREHGDMERVLVRRVKQKAMVLSSYFHFVTVFLCIRPRLFTVRFKHQKAEAGGSPWVQRQPGLQSEFQTGQAYIVGFNLKQKKIPPALLLQMSLKLNLSTSAWGHRYPFPASADSTTSFVYWEGWGPPHPYKRPGQKLSTRIYRHHSLC